MEKKEEDQGSHYQSRVKEYMQREIKFRAKHKKWVKDVWVVWRVPERKKDIAGRIDESTLGQFTGLKDKNGKEVWEGDILCVFDEAVVPVTDEGQGPIEPCNHLVAVEMRNGVWGFEIPASDDGETGWYGLHYWSEEISSDGFEVIGNIYENPELLSPTTKDKGQDIKS